MASRKNRRVTPEVRASLQRQIESDKIFLALLNKELVDKMSAHDETQTAVEKAIVALEAAQRRLRGANRPHADVGGCQNLLKTNVVKQLPSPALMTSDDAITTTTSLHLIRSQENRRNIVETVSCLACRELQEAVNGVSVAHEDLESARKIQMFSDSGILPIIKHVAELEQLLTEKEAARHSIGDIPEEIWVEIRPVELREQLNRPAISDPSARTERSLPAVEIDY
jgi:hypothetical protein